MTADGGIQALVEMTDTVRLPYTTGLQRVARELVTRLPTSGPVAYRPVAWSPVLDWYRALTPDEQRAISDPPEQLPRTTAMARHLPAPVATSVRRVLATTGGRRLRLAARDARHYWAERPLAGLSVGPPDRRTLLVDLEAAWNDPTPRPVLLDRLRRAGGRSVAMVADVLPVLHPEWFDRQLVVDFDGFLNGHLAHTDLFLCISERTRDDLLAVAERRGVRRDLDARVIPLGSDVSPEVAGTGDRGPGVAGELPPTIGSYLLVVGTIEPRKNQAMALDVFDALSSRHPDLGLVLVGKRGWLVDALIRRIETHRELGRRLVWLEEVDDARLGRLYRGASLCLAPALYEGLGMTVMEALQLGTPVIASTGGALPEAGGDVAEYADPHDVATWTALVERHLDDPSHHEAVRRRVAGYRPPTWDDAAAAVTDLVAEVFEVGRATT